MKIIVLKMILLITVHKTAIKVIMIITITIIIIIEKIIVIETIIVVITIIVLSAKLANPIKRW